MKNISFDNPYLLLLLIPLSLAVILPFLFAKNKNNRSGLWTSSLVTHLLIAVLATLAVAGLSSTRIMTKTTVYVLADLSYSSEKNADKIDEYIGEISENMPKNSSLGVVCFAKNSVVLTKAGGKIESVKSAEGIDSGATDIASALNYTSTLFAQNSLKRIILITDGNDTVSKSSGMIASTVENLTENGIKIDAVYIDASLREGEAELQLLDADLTASSYLGKKNEIKLLIQSNTSTDAMLELYVKPSGAKDSEYKKLSGNIVSAESGFTTVRLDAKTDEAGSFDYMAKIYAEGEISENNNSVYFSQRVVNSKKILHITGSDSDAALTGNLAGENTEIDTYVVKNSGSSVPVTLEALTLYDEIILSNVDIRNIKNVGAFLNSLDTAVSEYGKSLFTYGDLRIQTNSEDTVLTRLSELLPVKFGDTGVDGRLYTIVLDVSHSMFQASKFTTAKQTAINLLSVLEDDDYVSLITFSGEIKVHAPKKVKSCKDSLISTIDSLTTGHGTELGLGLEEALKTVKSLDLTENRIMVISDGFSFDSVRAASEVSGDLFREGASVSVVNTYVAADGNGGISALKSVASAGGGKYYEIRRPEDVSSVVFGDLANDLGALMIEKDVSITVASKNTVLDGISEIAKISGFIVSKKSYDAIAPLTITYVKDNGLQETVPFYAERAHGNGLIATITSSLTGEWVKHWEADDLTSLLGNVVDTVLPKERIDRPFTLNIERDGLSASITLKPSELDPNATAVVKITSPDARTVTRNLTFDSAKYLYSFDTPLVGTYRMDITYSAADKSYNASETFSISYLSEYDAFAPFDKFSIYDFLRGNGTLNENAIPSLALDEDEITYYKESFVIPLLAAMIVLFAADVFLRKLRVSKKHSNGRKENLK